MLKINKNINLTGYSTIGEVQVVYLNASISTDGTSNANKSTTILNQDLYNKNKVEIRKDILEFSTEVYKVEDEIITGGTI